MPAYTVTDANYGSITVNGTKPFKAVQEGGVAGALRILDANNTDMKVKIKGETATSTFANYASNKTKVDALVTALNAAT